MRLQNKIALLTGAAAAIKGELMGFGGAAAHLFVREGAKWCSPTSATSWASAGGIPARRGP